MDIMTMTIEDYEDIYELQTNSPGMGLKKVALVAFSHNEIGNEFWEHQGFIAREDLVYRNKALAEIERIDTQKL